MTSKKIQFQGTRKPPKLWKIIKIIVAIILIGFVISKTNLHQLRLLQQRISWEWMILTPVAFVCALFIKSGQYHTLIDKEISYWSIVRIVIWQSVISNFVATGAGIASYMAMLKAEQNVKLTRSGVVFAISKFCDLLAICLYLGLSTGLVWDQIQPLYWLTILLIGGMLLGLGSFLVTIVWRERFVVLVTHLLVWLKLDRFSLVTQGMEMLRSLAREEQSTIFSMLKSGVLFSLAYMTVTIASTYIIIQMFDVQIGFWAMIYVTSLMQLVSFIPIQILGGLGVSEVTSVYLYSIFGLDQGEMSAVMLGLRALFYMMNLVILLYLPVDAFLARNRKS